MRLVEERKLSIIDKATEVISKAQKKGREPTLGAAEVISPRTTRSARRSAAYDAARVALGGGLAATAVLERRIVGYRDSSPIGGL